MLWTGAMGYIKELEAAVFGFSEIKILSVPGDLREIWPSMFCMCVSVCAPMHLSWKYMLALNIWKILDSC